MLTTLTPITDLAAPQTRPYVKAPAGTISAANIAAINANQVAPATPAPSFLTPKPLSWINTPYYNIPPSVKKKAEAALNPVAAVSNESPVETQEPATEQAQPTAQFVVTEAVASLMANMAIAAQTDFVPETVPSYAPVQESAPVQEYAPVQESAPVQEQQVYVAETMEVVQAPVESMQAVTPLDGFDVNKLEVSMLQMAAESVHNHVLKVTNVLAWGGDGAKTFCKIFLNDLALQKTVLCGLMNEPGNPLSNINFSHKELALRLASCGQARLVAQVLLADHC